MAKPKIIINNHKCRLISSLKLRMKLYKKFAIKHPNAFWVRRFMQRGWDGLVHFIGEDSGLFKTGHLPNVCKILDDMGKKYDLVDNRELFKDLHSPERIEDLEARDYQEGSRLSVVNSRFKGVRWQRGILDEATNAGKTLITALLIDSFSDKRVSLFLVDEKTLLNQAYGDFCQLFGKDKVGIIASKYPESWKKINICMVQTFEARLKKNPKYKTLLSKVDILVVDEADKVIGRKGTKKILEFCYNATVRLALTGTALIHKDPLRNMELLAFFGPVLHKITNKELVDKGVSTPPDIRITMGSKKNMRGSYDEQYQKGIIRNKDRHRKIWARAKRHLDRGHIPILILFREHKHADRILANCPEEIREAFRIEIVHGKTSNRESILTDFNEGKIDILVGSMILKRGKNIPLMQALINAAGGDSEVTVLQFLGRALRKHESKKKVYIEDFWDLGRNLRRHSYHREKAYKKTQFEVKQLYKTELNKLNKKLTINKYGRR